MRKLEFKILKKILRVQLWRDSLLTLSIVKINPIDMGQDLHFFG